MNPYIKWTLIAILILIVSFFSRMAILSIIDASTKTNTEKIEEIYDEQRVLLTKLVE